jgi:hypothetical protein
VNKTTETRIVTASPRAVPDRNATLVLDRPHRFAIGDRVRHVDDEGAYCVVTALTLRNTVGNVFVPTYTLTVAGDDPSAGDVLEDIICTRDLISVR